MTVLTTDSYVQTKRPDFHFYPMADNVKIQKGQYVCFNASGYAVQAADTSGFVFLGIAEEVADNTITGHTAGGVSVKVRQGEIVLKAVGTGFAQSSCGATLYIVDANTIGLTGASSNKVVAGSCVGYHSATSVDLQMAVPALPGLNPAGGGGVKTATVALAGGTDTGGGIGAWQNPEASEINITSLAVTTSVVASAACNLDAGTTATNATTLSDNLIDGLDVHTALVAGANNAINAGANGKAQQPLASGKWVTFSTGDSTASAGLVGKAYITYQLLN